MSKKTRNGEIIHKGQIVFTRTQGDGCDYISIYLEDSLSSGRVVEIRVKYADFAMALMTEHRPCEFIHTAKYLGKVREVKTEPVMFDMFALPTNSGEREKIVKRFLSLVERDGWVGRVSDMTNIHKRNENGYVIYQNVGFVRYVDPTHEEVKP